MNKLDLVMANINKDYGESLVTLGAAKYISDKVSLSSPRMNYLLYGGLPSNKAIEIYGPEHGGKTTTALDVLRSVQEKEKRVYENKLLMAEDALSVFDEKGDVTSKAAKAAKEALEQLTTDGPRRCVYVDAENTLDLDWVNKLGVDVSSMLLVRPQEQSAEQVMQMMLDIIDSGQVACMVMDSWPMLVPQNLAEEDMTKKGYGGISGPLSQFCSKLVGMGRLSKNNTMFIGINQVRDDLENPYNLYKTPGGRNWRHICAVRLLVQHGSWFDDKNEELANKDAKTPAGNNVNVAVIKNKCARSDRRMGFYRLNYVTGIDVLADMLDVAILFGIVQKAGSWYVLPGEVKVQGLKAVNAYYAENPEEIAQMSTLVNQKIVEN